MDLNRALKELYEERERVDRAIHALESGRLAHSRAVVHRRGRKMMPPEERLAVSKRMTEYWRAKRAAPRVPPKEIAIA